MKFDTVYRLAQGVAVRTEKFGGLVYRHDNRRLYFLHSHEMVGFLNELDGLGALGEVLDRFIEARGLPETTRDTLLDAVAQLEKLGVVIPVLEHHERTATPIQPVADLQPDEAH
jgi:putative mycofactocin binding protein MftB